MSPTNNGTELYYTTPKGERYSEQNSESDIGQILIVIQFQTDRGLGVTLEDLIRTFRAGGEQRLTLGDVRDQQERIAADASVYIQAALVMGYIAQWPQRPPVRGAE